MLPHLTKTLNNTVTVTEMLGYSEPKLEMNYLEKQLSNELITLETNLYLNFSSNMLRNQRKLGVRNTSG